MYVKAFDMFTSPIDSKLTAFGSFQAFVWHIKTKIDLKNETNIWKHDLITK